MKRSAIKPEIFEKYNAFYALAFGDYSNALMLENISASAPVTLSEHEISADAIVLTNCPSLTSVDFLSAFKNAKYILIKDLKLLTSAFDISTMPSLKGIAFINCKKLTNFEKLANASSLQNIIIESGVFSTAHIKSLVPLHSHTGLKTLDLAFKSIVEPEKHDFNIIWPMLEALTISPNLRKYFVSQGDK